jgi:PAS domain S-box-containing protein
MMPGRRGDEEIQAALRGEREFDTEFRVLWPDGTTHSIRAMACVQRDGFGKPLRMNGTNWDITTFKQADENLRTLSRAVEFSPSMILVTDHLGKIQYVNPAWEEKTGYRMEEARGRRPSMLKSGTHAREFYANMWSEIGAGRVWRGELCNRKKNGELFWESTAIAPVHNKAGVTIHFVAVKEDITERKRAAEQLRQAKETAELANKAKSTFLANMSHEIRTPMNAILGFSQLMLRDLDVSVVHREQLTTIARSGEHLMDIINDILEMARVESGRAKLHPSIFDLHQLLTDIKSLFTLRTQARNLRLSIEIHEGLPRHILADETKLRQVIINLLGNAVKFTPTGGAIILRAGISGDANSMLRLNVEVEDSGAGIAPGDIEHLFEPFYQTSIGTQTGGGTGLGLPISREFVRLMGGDLTVSSRVGSGSTFRFDVRITRAEESGAMAQTEPERRVLSLLPGLPAWRVLEVDDEDHNRELIECLLAPAGFELRSACNGVEAVEQCKAWSPHLVLLDLRMPVMDGFEAARRIRAEFSPAPKIIALSACAFASDRQQAMAEGADAFIAKPFQTADLFETIRQLAGVEYVYSNSKTAEAASQAGDAAPLPCAEELQRLPSGLVEAFLKAIRLADYDQMLALVDQMAARDEPLGRRFRQWVQKFDYDTLLKVLSPNINNEKEIHE